MGSHRYNEWQTLAYEATVDRRPEYPPESSEPLKDHTEYSTSTKIMKRPAVDPVSGTLPKAAISLETADVSGEIDYPDHPPSEEFSGCDLKVKEEGLDTRSGNAISAEFKTEKSAESVG